MDCLTKVVKVLKNKSAGIILISVFKTLWKETLFIRSETLLELPRGSAKSLNHLYQVNYLQYEYS